MANTRGSAAIEFAMIAPLFFGILFPMFEIGITFAADAVLQNAVNEASRRIRTGEVQAAGLTAGEFREMVCDELAIPLNCGSDLAIDVRTGQSSPTPTYGGGTFGSTAFNPGAANDVVVVRAYYAWTPLTPYLGEFMDNLSEAENKHLLQAAAAFRNEPF